MTNREREILNIVRENPLISQDEIAKRLGITRSSVAVHITNLMKKGLILGKGYVLPQNEDYVYVIGAANVDMLGYPKSKLKLKDSNPGNLKISFGGVGRNIAENLARMGVKTKLLTLLGEDIYGRKIYDHAKKIGIDVSSVYFLEDKQTSTYISIQDEEGDMALALSCMDIYDEFKVDYIKENKGLIKNSKCIVVDTNLPEDVLKYISEEFEVPIFLDTVSTTKALKVKDFIGNFYCIKPNKYEAEALTGIKINDEKDLKICSDYFLQRGVKRIFISLGEDGVFYSDGRIYNLLKAPKIEAVNSNGAGDAFVAGLVFGFINGYDIDLSAKLAMAASIIALKSEDTINPNIDIDSIQSTIKEMGL